MKYLPMLQTYLDRISDCWVTGDFDTWEASVVLPFSLVAKSGTSTSNTVEALRAEFEFYVEMIKGYGVTDIIRRAELAEPIDDEQLIGTYETHILSNGRRITDPYTSSVLLKKVNQEWRAATVMNAIGRTGWVLGTTRTPHTHNPNQGGSQ